jgi:Leucine-rich repeat (LRR) protein
MRTFKPLLLIVSLSSILLFTGCSSGSGNNGVVSNNPDQANGDRDLTSPDGIAPNKGVPLSEVYFVDDNLQRCVESTGAEFTGQVQALECGGKNISHLGGIESLRELNTLILSHNDLSDISELTDMHQLVTLFIDNNQIHELSSIEALTQLHQLSIHDNQLTSVDELKDMQKLVKLYADNNMISDFTALEYLNALKHLSVKGNDISEYDRSNSILKNSSLKTLIM